MSEPIFPSLLGAEFKDLPQPLQELHRHAKLPRLRPLRQVARHHDDVRTELVREPDHRLRCPRHERPPALEVRGVEDGQHDTST